MNEALRAQLKRILDDPELLAAMEAFTAGNQAYWEKLTVSEAQDAEPNQFAIQNAAIHAKVWSEVIPVLKVRVKERDAS